MNRTNARTKIRMNMNVETMRRCAGMGVLTAVCLLVGGGPALSVQTLSRVSNAVQREGAVTTHIRGTFDVKLTPRTSDDNTQDATLGRMSIDKQIHGDLEATSKGTMLTAGTALKDSGVYVAIERVTGTLGGRGGSFTLHHTGIMNRGAQSLAITVVPDSATGQLEGLAGTMTITIVDGKHFYDFEYTLPAAAK